MTKLIDRWRNGQHGSCMMVTAGKQVFKKAVLAGLGSGWAVERKLSRIRASGAITVLNLHRVAPDDFSTYRPLDPALFGDLLRFVDRHFAPVTFAEIEASAGERRPRLVLSFDDGYKDFIDVAMPMLASAGIRVNQNVIPGCVESGRPPLNVVLQDFVGRAPQSALDALEVPGLPARGRSEPRLVRGTRISDFLKNKSRAEQSALESILLDQIAGFDFAPTPMMSLDDVRQVAGEHELGAHSYDHANMGAESDAFVRDDVRRCQAWFRDSLDLPLTIYAFPNGSYRTPSLEVVRAEGIRTLLLVDEDFASGRDGVFRRFTFDALSRAELRFRATGAWRWPRPGTPVQ